MLFRASRASFAGLRVTESGSVAGSGAQPLLDNNRITVIIIMIIMDKSSKNIEKLRAPDPDWGCSL